MKSIASLAAAFTAMTAAADFKIEVDPAARPIRDLRESTCFPVTGYAGCTMTLGGVGGADYREEFWFRDNAEETSRVMREAGAWLQRMWNANEWFRRRVPDKNPDPNKRYRQTHPDIAFKFWKENGIKLLFTLEARAGVESDKKDILEFVKWIIDNDYKSVVAGFELGNETYYSPRYVLRAPGWTELVHEIRKMWPDVKLGICLAELFENNPDISQVRNRMLADGKIDRDTYFAAAEFNRYSAQFVVAMSNCIDQITHVIYHAYGGETPYSCSYHGFQRFRNFCSAFPELKDKKLWLTEVRLRSDEDNRCQRMFRESLVMAHYSLMAVCQPDLDGFNHHQLFALSGGIYQSDGKKWNIQWRDAASDYPDFRAPLGRPRLAVGSCGVMYRILTEAIMKHPFVLRHGTSRDVDTEDSFFTSARVMDQVYARRRALKEGATAQNAPKVEGEVEWVALADAFKNDVCLLMVNTKSEPVEVEVCCPGRMFAAPTYVTLSCPEKYLDCREVPGDGRFWRQVSWEDTQFGYDVVQMEKYEGLTPKAGRLVVTIDPHTVQSVTFMTRKVPEKKSAGK